MNSNRHIEIMGIVNLTDDSYFAESRCEDVAAVLRRVEQMVEEGVDIIDLGACSTRPGAEFVGADEEWKRLEPALTAIRDRYPDLRLSIDTCFSSVVERAYGLIGDFIVNDITAGEMDPEMLPVVGRFGLRYVAMHMRGNPQTMQSLTDYNHVTQDVKNYFEEFSVKADKNGIKDWILDPGFGFAKTIAQNYKLLSELSQLKSVRRADGTAAPVLVGISRKSMIYKLLGVTPDESLSASQALHMVALQNGTDVLRVHDVAAAKHVLKLYNALFV